MSSVRRHGRTATLWVLCLALLAFVVFAAYRMVSINRADRNAAENPELALSWHPRHPKALLVRAGQQLAANQLDAARATALQLLAVEPLEGRAFRVLAEVAAQQGDDAKALSLYRIAALRSPRDTPTRVWLANHHLLAGDYAAALVHLDYLLRTSPAQSAPVLTLLSQRASDPVFAADLARVLARRPPWRQSLLAKLQGADTPHAADTVMSALRSAGGLSAQESEQWIASLLRQGRWGEAYSRWAGTLDLKGAPLPLVYNGKFERPVAGGGFNWRTTAMPGVSVQFVAEPGTTGLSALASFRGRPVPRINLEQPLLLGPGRYRFSARVRAEGLRSENGLQWVVTCEGQAEPLASSERLQDTFDWRTVSFDFVVPASNCPGQWLRIRNPAPGGMAQQVWGQLWLDDVAIEWQG